MADIFISYSSDDLSRAGTLAQVLEEKGWSVWWDRKIPPGKTFSQVIEEAINAAKCVIVLWSDESVKSDWVQNEAAEGARKGILVPVLIDDVQIPFEFRRIQAADLTEWRAEAGHSGFAILFGAISEIVGPSSLKVKEAGQKRAEDEHRRMQEEEKKRREDERKRADAERKAEEESNQKVAVDKRKTDVDTTLDKEKLWNKMVIIIAEKLSLVPEEVVPDAAFVDDLGADSLDLVEMVMAMEEEFEVEISDEDAERIQTVKDAFAFGEAMLGL